MYPICEAELENERKLTEDFNETLTFFFRGTHKTPDIMFFFLFH